MTISKNFIFKFFYHFFIFSKTEKAISIKGCKSRELVSRLPKIGHAGHADTIWLARVRQPIILEAGGQRHIRPVWRSSRVPSLMRTTDTFWTRVQLGFT
jgi:hypothetical protein